LAACPDEKGGQHCHFWYRLRSVKEEGKKEAKNFLGGKLDKKAKWLASAPNED